MMPTIPTEPALGTPSSLSGLELEMLYSSDSSLDTEVVRPKMVFRRPFPDNELLPSGEVRRKRVRIADPVGKTGTLALHPDERSPGMSCYKRRKFQRRNSKVGPMLLSGALSKTSAATTPSRWTGLAGVSGTTQCVSWEEGEGATPAGAVDTELRQAREVLENIDMHGSREA